jgi:UDP-N-acetylmuramyl tripeptide synthase
MLGVDLEKAAKQLERIMRLCLDVLSVSTLVSLGQTIVDYAPEPESFKQLYRALKAVPRERTIHVLGSCGGGRDVARRPILGQLAAVECRYRDCD